MKGTQIAMTIVLKIFLMSCLLEAANVERVYDKLPVKEITVFKDGHSFVLHEGYIQPNESGDIVLDELPQPVLGTFWAYSADPDNAIQCVIAGQNEVKNNQTVANLIELLKLNINNPILVKEQSFQQAYQAEIVKILSDQIVLLKQREGTKAVKISQIQNVTFLGMPTYDQTVTEMQNLMTIKLKHKSSAIQKANIGMAYVQKGLRWIPGYRIEIDGKGKAIVKLQGTIVNELIDLNNVKAHLVVGVPSFAFKDMVDPISLKETTAELSRRMNRYDNNRTSMMLSNSIMSQVAYSGFDNDFYQPQNEESVELGPELKGSGTSEDMFVFSLDNLNLKKGERMVIPIAEYELSYADIYTVDISFQPPFEMRRNFNSQQHLEIAKQFYAPKVIHKVRLDNKAEYPLTTAPATILKDGMVLSQSMMKYTPIGGEGDLEITTAVNIKVKSGNEQEGIEDKAVKWNYDFYSKVNMVGDVKLTNYSDKMVKVFIKRSVLGNMDEAGQSGEIMQLGHSYDGLIFEDGLPFWWNWCSWPWWWYHFNSVGRASWEIELAPGQDITLDYKWHYYWQ